MSFRNIGWSLGSHCNAACRHCYSALVRDPLAAHLSLEGADTIIDRLIAYGVQSVNIGGNEPIFTNGPDFRQSLLPHILKRLSEGGIAVGITSNGVSVRLLAQHYSQALDHINDLDISLDSPFAAEHDDFRQACLFESAIDAARQAVANGTPTALVVCGMNWNLTPPHLNGLIALAVELGTELRINFLKPMNAQHMDLLPKPEQYYDTIRLLLSSTELVTLGEPTAAGVAGVEADGCPCGRQSFRINSMRPDGTVPISPCVYLHDFAVGDLLTQNVEEIVSLPRFNEIANRSRSIPRDCLNRDCSWLQQCRGGCAARTWLMKSDLQARDPYCPDDVAHDVVHDFPSGTQAEGIGIRVHDNYLCTWIGRPVQQADGGLE